MTNKALKAQHGTIVDMSDQRYGYFAWPSVTRTEDGTLVVGCSGLRFEHLCPWGKTVIFTSTDEGRTWSPPRVINDTPLDDRDCGIVSLGGQKLLITWFASDTRKYYETFCENGAFSPEELARWKAVYDTYTEEMIDKWVGSWIRISPDGQAWSDFIRAPVNTPHGPIMLQNGQLLYFGKEWKKPGQQEIGSIMAARSSDDGKTWTDLGKVPLAPNTTNDNFHEPHVVETASGKLLGLIRYESRSSGAYTSFSLFQTESTDGGKTWSQAKYLDTFGSPPHLIRHSSGPIVCVYTSRREPFGELAMITHDQGQTWDRDYQITGQRPPVDQGYPCSVEMPDGSIFTVYYQRPHKDAKKANLMYSRWQLPG